MKRQRISITLIAAVLTLTTSAQKLTWQQATEKIVNNNPGLKELKLTSRAQSLQASDEARALDGTEFEFEHLWGKAGDKKWNIGVTQGFDWPGSYTKKKKAAQAQATALEALVAQQTKDVEYSALSTFDKLTYCNQKLALLNKMLQNMDSLEAYINTGYQQGQLTILDVKKIQLEVYGLKSNIAEVEQERISLEAKIEILAGGLHVDVDCSAYELKPFLSLAEYESMADKLPNTLLAKAKADAALAQARAASSARLPGVSVGYRHAYEENQHFDGLSVGMTLPLFGVRKAAEAAKLEAEAYLQLADSNEAENLSIVHAAYENANYRRTQYNELSKVTLDNNYPDLLMMAYKGGQINVLTYIQEINFFMSARMDYLAAEYEMQASLTELFIMK